MGGQKTIAVLFHESVRPSEMRMYRIWHCARIWSEQGIRVQMLRGFDELREADLLIPQIDLSVLPKAYHHLLNLEVPVVNRGVVDIRKSVFSRNLVSLRDSYDGPVIVKTDTNHGGIPERRAAMRRLPLHKQILKRSHELARAFRNALISGSLTRLSDASTLKPENYPVYASKHQVPQEVFKNDHLVVEKFLPERKGDFYYLRSYAFLGDEGLAVRFRAEFPVVKGSVGANLEFVPVDESIVTARRELGFDYGKFDYVIHDGEAVLLDINPTPTFGRAYSLKVRSWIAAQLAQGVSKWFPNPKKLPN